ncbi:multivesicular body subunit 12B-like [Clupea harengus]|uniref:Multivesicular body subunit 12B-like n=1 Tax=Clupea harengus TaxID=7950 RepID=A0A6P8FTD0_CLUHA|nr:multivesicular body subunit 12B-like [Clupea harengus]
MPEVQEASRAQSPVTSDPITAVGVVASKNGAPADFYVVAQTTDGCDADLWKDGLFKSKVTRFLCFSRASSPQHVHEESVLVDLKLMDLKDSLPADFTPIQETIDTQQPALSKKRLCVKFAPRLSVATAVCEIQILGRSKHTPSNFTFIGELNGMSIWYRMGDLPQTPSLTLASMTLDGPTQHRPTSSSLASSLTKTRPVYELPHSGGLYTISAMDGIPFTISEKFVTKRQDVQQGSLMSISIKSAAEIEEEFQYTFSTEYSSAPYLASRHTQSQP